MPCSTCKPLRHFLSATRGGARSAGSGTVPALPLSAPLPDWGIPPNERLPPATDGYRPAPTNVCKGRFGRLASLDVKPGLTRTRCLCRGTASASPWPGTGCVRAKLEPAEAAVRARTPHVEALDRVGFFARFDSSERVLHATFVAATEVAALRACMGVSPARTRSSSSRCTARPWKITGLPASVPSARGTPSSWARPAACTHSAQGGGGTPAVGLVPPRSGRLQALKDRRADRACGVVVVDVARLAIVGELVEQAQSGCPEHAPFSSGDEHRIQRLGVTEHHVLQPIDASGNAFGGFLGRGDVGDDRPPARALPPPGPTGPIHRDEGRRRGWCCRRP